jgi:hypothetical protein
MAKSIASVALLVQSFQRNVRATSSTWSNDTIAIFSRYFTIKLCECDVRKRVSGAAPRAYQAQLVRNASIENDLPDLINRASALCTTQGMR